MKRYAKKLISPRKSLRTKKHNKKYSEATYVFMSKVVKQEVNWALFGEPSQFMLEPSNVN